MSTENTATVTPIGNESEDVALAKIRRYIKESPQNSRVITFTPEASAQILTEFNIDNRPKKPSKIAEYARDMANGLWAVTGDTIKFSNKMRLRDGQNRLMASVRAGVPFTSHVVFGIPDEAFDVMDRGRNRDPSDILAIAGFADTSNLAAATRWTRMLLTGTVPQRPTFEPKDVLVYLQQNYPDLPPFLTHGRKVSDTPTGMAAAHLYAFSKIDPVDAALFGDAWATGTMNGKFVPLGRLATKLADIKKQSSGRIHDVVRSALIIKAWNLYRANRKGSSKDFEWTTGKDFPVIG